MPPLTQAPPQPHHRIVSALPGRVRLHLPSLSQQKAATVERRLLQLSGVRSARANALTGNVLITFEPAHIGIEALLAIAAMCDTTTYAATSIRTAARRPTRPHTSSVHARVPSTPTRSLVSPSGLGFLLKGTSVTGGLLAASSPLALLLGALEALQLVGDIRAHLHPAVPSSDEHTDRCANCGHLLPSPPASHARHSRVFLP